MFIREIISKTFKNYDWAIKCKFFFLNNALNVNKTSSSSVEKMFKLKPRQFIFNNITFFNYTSQT